MITPNPLSGPGFSSYPESDVLWLLTDVSGRVQQTTGEDRESHLQRGGHYFETLPVEYQPTGDYVRLVMDAIERRAPDIARAVARVGDQIMLERAGAPVLVSLARAGTPVGIMLRRWLRYRYGYSAPHYTMSIILGRGLDPVAVRYIVQRHSAESVAFVDGWTGKGSISRELATSITALGSSFAGLHPGLAVLADPAGTAAISGTLDDVLIPSAMLNSTVSGLISRTVYSPALIAPGAFHGAQFATDLLPHDLSALVVDSVSNRFDEVRKGTSPQRPTRGSVQLDDELERISIDYAVARTGLIKVGICETTRVLLRRLPRAVLLAKSGSPDVAHLEYLAEERGVPVIEDPRLGFGAVGLISDLAGHP